MKTIYASLLSLPVFLIAMYVGDSIFTAIQSVGDADEPLFSPFFHIMPPWVFSTFLAALLAVIVPVKLLSGASPRTVFQVFACCCIGIWIFIAGWDVGAGYAGGSWGSMAAQLGLALLGAHVGRSQVSS